MKKLTEECADYEALYRCKVLEEDELGAANLRRRMHTYGHDTAQINQAVNMSDRFEVHEGLAYKISFDPISNGLKLVW